MSIANKSDTLIVDIVAQVNEAASGERESLLLELCGDDENLLKQVTVAINLQQDHTVDPSILIRDISEQLFDVNNNDRWVTREFGDWVGHEVIHSSSKSVVLKGQNKNNFSQQVAIKILSPTYQLISNDKLSEMQASYMANIGSVNTVEVKTASTTDDGIKYIVMEYLPNGDIVSYCRDNNLSLAERLSMFKQVCTGVSYMHRNMLVHADLKPDNILIAHDGTPKIIDFDLCLALDQGFHREYDFQNVFGKTNKYASPEQMSSSSKLTGLSDVYSLGLILREIVFDDDVRKQDHSIFKKRYHTHYSYDEFNDIVKRCIAAKPQDRYSSVESLIIDIELFITGKGIAYAHREKASFLYKSYRYVLSRKKPILALATIGVITLISIHSITQQRNEAIEAISLLALNQDPRANTSEHFDQKAQELLHSKPLDKDEHFKQLIHFGDAYYGQGDGMKAIGFFEKAISIYSDRYDPRYIEAVTKLAQANTIATNAKAASDLLEPYILKMETGEDLSAPMAELFLAFFHIHFAKYYFLSDDMQNRLSNILQTFSIDKSEPYEKRRDLALLHKAYSAAKTYYELPGGFFTVAHNRFVTKAMFENELKNNLNQTRLLLLEALSQISHEKIKTHYRPFILGWLGRIESELGNYESAQSIIQDAKTETLIIFGPDHFRSIEMYFREFALHRYRDNRKALEAVRQIFDGKPIPKDVLLAYNLALADAYDNLGMFYDIKQHYADFKGYIETQSEVASQVKKHVFLSHLLGNVTEWGLFFPKELRGYMDEEIRHEFAKLTIEGRDIQAINTDTLSYHIYQMKLALYNGNDEYFKQYLAKSIDFLLSNYDDVANYYYAPDLVLQLAELCFSTKMCNVNPLLDKLPISSDYSDTFRLRSGVNKNVLIRQGFLLMKLERFDQLKAHMAELDLIFSVDMEPQSFYYGMYLLLKGHIELKQNASLTNADIEKGFTIISNHIQNMDREAFTNRVLLR